MTKRSEARRAKRLNNLPQCFSSLDWKHAVNWFNCSCAYCGKRKPYEELTRDHFIPVNHPRCPGTVITNIVPACFRCNSEKSDSDPAVWLDSRFGTLEGFRRVVRIVQYFQEMESNVDCKRYV